MPPIRPNSVLASAPASTCRIVFGRPAAAVGPIRGEPTLGIAIPLLLGPATECVLEGTEAATTEADCTVFDVSGRRAGFALAEAGADLESAARDVYRRVFAAAGGLKLYRIWNYVPHINRVEGGLENYRRFCRGRSYAFEEHFGQAFQRQLPAASAVGAIQGPLAIVFLAGEASPQHFENPCQVPAFEYPPAYGPRPPSFSRATLVATGTQRELFISGTAAIRGHATVAAKDLAGQLACTRENLEVIATTAGAGADFGAADRWQRTLKVYLRHETDLLQVQSDLERHLLQPDDAVTYLQADLCRADLLVEIEAVLTNTA